MKNRLLKWLLLFGFFTIIGLANFNRFTANELAVNRSPAVPEHLINEMTGAYTVLLLLPALLWFFNRFPLARRNWLRRVPLYLLANVLFGASHTLLMFGSRRLLYPVLLEQNYEYGHLGYRFLMEYNHQFFTFWIVYAVYFLIRAVRENQQQKLRAAQLEQQLSAAQLQALQMQLNPHFLFNTLNMISAAMHEEIETADRMLTKLSDLLRLTLNRANWKKHTLRQELEFLQLYLDIMQARFDSSLVVDLAIADETLEAKVPSFILQPLVENAIRYSIEFQENRPAEVRIAATCCQRNLVLTVADNGPGLDGEKNLELTNGVGISNTTARLDKLYGGQQAFSWRNRDEGGFEVTIEIPLEKKRDEVLPNFVPSVEKYDE